MVLVPCAAWVGYAGHLAVLGSLGGRRSWVGSALLVGGEPTLRFVLVLVVALLGSSLMGFEIASAASVVFWLGLLVVSSEARSAARARADAGWRVLVRRIGQAMIASSGSAVLVVAFPTLMRATTDAALWPAAAPLVMAINLTRAPLMLPLTALQGVIISHFLNATGRRSAALLRILGLVAAIGAVGTVGAYLLGPWLMTTFFGAEYHLSGGLLASLTAASVGLAALTVVGACVLATDRHAAFAAGWLLAAVVAVGVLLAPWDLQTRALVALAVAPVVGLVVHLVALRPMLTERRAGPVAAA
jgi:O-antigen/teichoic acid export membrane protein